MLDPIKMIEEANKAWDQAEHPETPKSAIDDLRNGGTLSRTLPGYQERGPQIEMAQMVEEAIQKEKHCIAEAATGTGKSLGYLIPIIRSRKKAIVSTANKALQDQLFNKDIPFCQKHIQSFEAALLKGKSNYLCLERLSQEEHEGMQAHAQDPLFDRLEKAITDGFNGDFETLPFIMPGEIRTRINVDDDNCARRKCPSFASCYYYQAREQAKNAQIIITNHDLLLLDAESNNKLLPTRDIVVVDEAHTLEAVATKQFSIDLRPSQITSLLALQRIKSYTDEKTRNQAKEQAERLWTQLDTLIPSPGRVAFSSPILTGLALAKTIERISNQLQMNRPQNGTEKDDELYKRTIKRADNLADNIHAVFSVKDKKYVYFLEKIENHITATMTPLDIAPKLRDTLFSQNKTLICCSATLSTPSITGEPTFDYFEEQTGMDRPDTIKRILPLVFDYKSNAVLYLPDLPEPAYGKNAATATYEWAVAQSMLSLIEAAQGRTFLLFSSRRMLNNVSERIMPALEANGYSALLQGDLPTNELIKQFKTSQKAVLFGLKTFWEGVDVPGEALSLVVVDKLPFSPMDDPVVAAKLKYIEEEKGKNAFNDYSLPSITIALKQAVGRLIRSDNDSGVMAILDARLQNKPYGRKVLRCLPPATRAYTIKDIQVFFSPLGREIQQFDRVKGLLLKKGKDKYTYFPQVSNGELIQKMERIINNPSRTDKEVQWLSRGLSLILRVSFKARK